MTREAIEVVHGPAGMHDEPVLAVCGFSGSGKTTLIEAVLPVLLERGLAVAVIKHDAHGLDIDRPGKDSDRLFRAGADVLLRGPGEAVVRTHGGGDLRDAIERLVADHDLVLVEGHKSTPLPKVWLGDDAPCDLSHVCAALPSGGEGRESELIAAIEARLEQVHAARPLMAGVLVGGASTRMGRPKQLIEVGGVTMFDRAAGAVEARAGRPVALGGGALPPGWGDALRLPDPSGVAGPMAGLLAAMRWAPRAAWLIASCDLPAVDAAAIDWLLDQRQPGRWAVLPTLDGVRPEPLLAVYEPQARWLLESAVRSGGGPSRLAGHRSVALVQVPARLRACWRDADAAEDLPG